MKYIDLPKPHGFLIWRQKQKAIASPTPLLSGESIAIISEGEAFGEATLSNPVAVNLKGFEDLQDEHCIRPEERKLYWPDAQAFYIHHFTDWQPYQHSKAVCCNNGDCEFVEIPEPTEAQKALLDKAERLPKTVILLDEAVILNGDKAIINAGLDSTKIEPVLKATFDGLHDADSSISLYQLALVRVPRLQLKKKEMEAQMPYEKLSDATDCDGIAVVKEGTTKVLGCHEDEEAANRKIAALMAAEKKGALAVFSDDKEMSLDRKVGAIREAFYRTFHPEVEREQIENNHVWLRELYEDYAIVDAAGKLYSVPYTNGDKVVFAPSNDWVEVEMTYQPKKMNGSKQADDIDTKIQDAIERVLASRKWGDDGTSREEVKADDAGYLVTGDEGNHLPTKKNGKLDHGLMGAAWAALHSGFRGNKYEGPGKAQAIAKLKKLYEAEDMPLPGEKAGRRMAGRMVEKLKNMMSLMQELMGYAAPDDDDETMEGMPEGMMEMFSKKAALAIKQVDGKPWLVTYSTNAFKDREKEIFSTKALEKYVSEAEDNTDKGTFNLWHIPGTDFAKKEWQAVVGRFLIEAGPFLDDELGQKALAFFTDNPDGHKDLAPEGWGCSPEYRYLPEERKSGVYENIWITRTSVLPRLAAANIWTKGSVEMALSEQQKAAAVKIFGEDNAAKIIGGAEDATKDLEQAGVAHKGDTSVVIDVDAVAEAVAAKWETNMQPYADALQLLGQQVADLGEKFKSFEKSEKVKEQNDLPRYVFQMKRASEASETAVANDDPLAKMKPVETAVKDTSGAAHFFPAR